MFFERRLENLIEEFVPGVTDLHVILDMIPHSREYVRHLNITQLRVSDDKTYLDHFDFNTMLHKLCLLEELHVICNVRVCRMNFEWNMVELSEQDGECLAKAAQHCKTLKVSTGIYGTQIVIVGVPNPRSGDWCRYVGHSGSQ